jgi:hypothetical protein
MNDKEKEVPKEKQQEHPVRDWFVRTKVPESDRGQSDTSGSSWSGDRFSGRNWSGGRDR